jgi:hypothetical protein
MPRAWGCHPLPRVCLAIVLLLGWCGTAEAAQQPAKPRSSPAPRVIILPPKMVAGGPATLAVLDAQGRLLPGIAVEISGGPKVTTDVTGRALFITPDEAGSLVAKISGLPVTASAAILTPEDAARVKAGDSPPERSRIVSYPRVISIHDRFTLEGAGFRGAADLNHVSLNGDPCLVLAASSISLVVLPGLHVPVGDANLNVTVAGADAGQFPVSVVLLEITGPPEAVSAGSSGKLAVRALGSSAPLLVEIRNGSPAVIQLPKGNVQRLRTSGGDQNIATVDVKFVTGGNYSVSARLISSDINSPDLESVRRRLAEARKISTGDWPARIDQVLRKMDQEPQDWPRIRSELRGLLDDKPAPALALLLDSAWRELN